MWTRAVPLQVASKRDPDHLRLDTPARVADDRRSAGGGGSGDRSAPRRQFDTGIRAERMDDVEHSAADDPDVLVGRPPRIEDVICRDVLERGHG